MRDGLGEPFGGVFNRLRAGRAGQFEQVFYEADLNESARRMFSHVDRLFELLEHTDQRFLTTIELDVEPGRFPELVSACFSDIGWDYAKRFYLAAV